MKDEPSQRLVDQRTRNRIMEVMWSLARGDDAVREDGPAEYCNSFFDWVHLHAAGKYYPGTADQWEGLSTLTSAEDEAVRVVLA